MKWLKPSDQFVFPIGSRRHVLKSPKLRHVARHLLDKDPREALSREEGNYLTNTQFVQNIIALSIESYALVCFMKKVAVVLYQGVNRFALEIDIGIPLVFFVRKMLVNFSFC